MFHEVADRVFVARYPQWDVNVGLVLGRDAALVVDTRAAATQGRQVLAEALEATRGVRVRHVVNTHVHFDHTFGNVAFAGARIHAHINVAGTAEHDAEQVKASLRADPGGAPQQGYTSADVAAVLETPVRLPDETFRRSREIDLGDRVVVLRHAGRGHTDGDIGVFVPDADLAFLGDLVEESAPPSFGRDCWPLEWPSTLGALAAPLGAGSLVVPGHGAPVDAEFVARQRGQLEVVAAVIRERRLGGLSLDEARRTPDERLPFPLHWLVDAFTRGWAQLPAG